MALEGRGGVKRSGNSETKLIILGLIFVKLQTLSLSFFAHKMRRLQTL